MSTVPPIDIRHVFEGNTSQGCCATIEVDDEARVVFSSRSNDLKVKRRSVSLLSNIQCCVFGERREQRENRKTREAYERTVRDHGLDWNQVVEELGLDAESTEPITVGDHKKIGEYLFSRRSEPAAPASKKPVLEMEIDEPLPPVSAKKKGRKSKHIELVIETKPACPLASLEDPDDTHLIMSACSFPTLLERKEEPPVSLHAAPSILLPQEKEKSEQKLPRRAADSLPQIAPIQHWGTIGIDRYPSADPAHLEQEVMEGVFQEVADHFNDDRIGPQQVEGILAYFHELVQKKEEERERYEQIREKVEALARIVYQKVAADQKNPRIKDKFTPRTTKELVRYFVEADEELKAMYEEVITHSPAKEEELTIEIDNVEEVSERLKLHLGVSEEAAKVHSARVSAAQRVQRRMSGKLVEAKELIDPKEVMELVKSCATPDGSDHG